MYEFVSFQLIFTRDTKVKWIVFSFRHQNKWVNINFWRYLCILHVCRLKLCFWLTDPDKAKDVYVIFVKKKHVKGVKSCKKTYLLLQFFQGIWVHIRWGDSWQGVRGVAVTWHFGITHGLFISTRWLKKRKQSCQNVDRAKLRRKTHNYNSLQCC